MCRGCLCRTLCWLICLFRALNASKCFTCFVQARGGLSTSLPCGQDLAGVWGPLAAEQQRQRLRASGGGVPGHASVDDLALSRAGAAAGGRKRVSFSLPNSPRRGAADLSAPAPHASRQPPPLNLAGLAGRLQVQPPRGSAEGGANNSNQHGSAGGGVGGSSAAQYLPQLSPVLEALLGNVPTPLPHGVALAQPADGADLADDDLADMAGYSRWAFAGGWAVGVAVVAVVECRAVTQVRPGGQVEQLSLSPMQ